MLLYTLDAERAGNERWAREDYSDPALEAAFHQELSDAPGRWRFNVG